MNLQLKVYGSANYILHVYVHAYADVYAGINSRPHWPLWKRDKAI